MEILFLGTSAGMPIRGRNVTSIVLRLSENSGMFWMFDCGEATQHQLLQTPLKLTRLNKLFITHLHGDHVFGLPGLLSSRSSLGSTEPLELYGPHGLRELMETMLRISGTHLNYDVQVVEIGEGLVFEDDMMRVDAALLDHRIECFGYRITERSRTGALNIQWLAEAGVPPGPIYGRLKAGRDAVLDDGRVIRSIDVVGKSLPGRVIVVLGDTRPCANAVKLAQDADVLVHEATFAHDLAEKAEEYGHSTAVQAAEIAQAAGAKRLLITHFSSRYKSEDLVNLETQARAVFSHTDAAIQFTPYPVRRST